MVESSQNPPVLNKALVAQVTSLVIEGCHILGIFHAMVHDRTNLIIGPPRDARNGLLGSMEKSVDLSNVRQSYVGFLGWLPCLGLSLPTIFVAF